MVLRRRFKKKKTTRVISRPVKKYAEPLIVKAVVLLIKEQLNLLRAAHDLPELTNAQVLNAVRDKIQQLVEAKNMNLKWLEDVKE